MLKINKVLSHQMHKYHCSVLFMYAGLYNIERGH